MTASLRRAAIALVIASLAASAAAQKLDIKTEKDDKANFKAFKTYAWYPPAPIVGNVAPDAVTNPTLSQEALGPPIMAAVDRELASRGLVRGASDTADIMVSYFAALTVGFDSSYMGEYYGYITGWGSPIPAAYAPSTSMSVYEKGTVLIDVVDRASKRAVWRGTVVTRISQEHTLEKRVARINDGAAQLFKKFPLSAKR
jgi:hypothetical protein